MADQPKIKCEACGKEYRWKREYAGRKVKCTCGQVMVMPDAPPGVDEPEPQTFELEEADAPAGGPQAAAGDGDAACPSCGAAMATGAVLCVECGYNTQTGQKLDVSVSSEPAKERRSPAQPPGAITEDARARADAEEEEARRRETFGDAHTPLTEWVYPLITIGVGFAGSVIIAMLFTGARGVVGAVVYRVISLPVSVGFSLLGCLIVVKLLGMSFGPLVSALVKLAAVTIGSAFVTQLTTMTLAPLVGCFSGFIGPLFGFFASMGFLSWFFDLDMFEAIITAVVIEMLKFAAFSLVALTIMTFLF